MMIRPRRSDTQSRYSLLHLMRVQRLGIGIHKTFEQTFKEEVQRERPLSIITMPASIKDVPPEIFENILSHIRPVDYLKVKLVSKSFSDWASNVFKWEDMTMEEVVQGHTSVEASLPRGRPLNYCVCKHCGLVKPTNEFSDNQAVKTNHKRICISCGIGYNTYTKRQLPKINGEEHIPCWHCRKAVPKYDNWEEILVSGKAVLTKLLEETTPEGDPITYMTSDRRKLVSVHELPALALCKPCLRLMMRHRAAGPRLRH